MELWGVPYQPQGVLYQLWLQEAHQGDLTAMHKYKYREQITITKQRNEAKNCEPIRSMPKLCSAQSSSLMSILVDVDIDCTTLA